MKVKNEIISYESSSKIVKLWRNRWYLYAIFLHIKNFINLQLWIDYLINSGISINVVNNGISNDSAKLRKKWREIKTLVEINKMYKFSTKIERDD
jgi:hypothetical protein